MFNTHSIYYPLSKLSTTSTAEIKSRQHFSTVFTFETFQTVMTSRRRPVYLTIAEKYEIICMRVKGNIRQVMMTKYGIVPSTLHIILANSEKIKKQHMTISSLRRRRIRDLERVLYHWYLRCKERKVEITGADIQRKALEINKEINGNPNFKPSNSWLQKFKERHRITTWDIRGNTPFVKTLGEGNSFIKTFNCTLESRRFKMENVYNAVYTTLMWKAVPENTCIFKNAKSKESIKMCEDYVTALFCANATGCHKLPVLIIGNHSTFCSFETNAFTTIYRSNIGASMDSTIFKQWFKEHFLESVKGRQQENKREVKYLLLLDNTPLLHDINDIYHMDPLVTVIMTTSDVSSNRQPMNRGIIKCFKRMYRIELLKSIRPLSIFNTVEEMIDLHKELRMWDCCRIVHDAWSFVDKEILINSWDGLLRPPDMGSIIRTGIWNADILKAIAFLRRLPGCERCEQNDVLNWFNIDNGYDIVKKICTDEVLREFENNTLGRENINICRDEVGPSQAKI